MARDRKTTGAKGPVAPEPRLVPCDPTALGKLIAAPQALAPLLALVKARIPRDPNSDSYPETFAETLRQRLQAGNESNVLQLPANTRIAGDLLFDRDTDWVRAHRIIGVACDGDLVIEGDLLNRSRETGPFLFVGGRLDVGSLLKASATLVVLGDVESSGVFITGHNDGVTRIGGDVASEALVVLDHDFYVRGDSFGPVLDMEQGNLAEAFVREVYESEGDARPLATRLWAWQRAGLPILR